MVQPVPPADAGDGSMETILASIRRIIREDEAATNPPPVATIPVAEVLADEDDLLVLEPSMMVQPKIEEEVAMSADMMSQMDASRLAAELAAALFDDEPAAPSAPPPTPALQPAAAPPAARPYAALAPEPVPETIQPKPTHALTAPAADTLLAPQTRSAAVQSFAALQEMLKPEPPAPGGLRLLRSGGPTIEDMVREELRLQLKDWLDAHLPGLVEQLVRQEIERLVRPE